ncbi:MAG: hypothetical protein V4697_03805 [Patescibacteria group bacterium]
MQTKKMAIAVVKDGDKVLLRKKPAGSLPYAETWYLFGVEVQEDEQASIKNYLKNIVGIEVEVGEIVGQDKEIKADHDGVVKEFEYIDIVCSYKGGEPKLIPGAEKMEWVQKDKLKEYDLVPPSVKLFKKLGYL